MIYLDNILVFIDGGLEKYKKYIKQIISRLVFRNLKIKIKKYEFYKKEIFFLKYIVEVNGIKMDFKKIEAIVNWPVPKIIKKIQKFLDFANFNKYFIEKYSHKIKFLIQLM